jgi:hypothetical protein
MCFRSPVFYLFAFLIMFCTGTLRAQMHTSPRSIALSLANIADPHDGRDANPALITDSTVRLSADYMPLPSGLDNSWTAGVSVEYAVDKRDVIGASFDRFQYQSIYSNEDIAAQYSRSFGSDSVRTATVGARLRYSNTTYGLYYLPVGEITMDVGAVLQLASPLTLGITVIDLTSLYHSQNLGMDTLSAFLGLTYRPLAELALHAALESTTGSPLDLHGGIEYDLEQSITLRIGIESLTGDLSGGVGLRYNGFLIDVSLVRNPLLGDEFSFGLSTDL